MRIVFCLSKLLIGVEMFDIQVYLYIDKDILCEGTEVELGVFESVSPLCSDVKSENY